MGLCGYYLSPRAVFTLAGALALPALFALSRIKPDEIGPAPMPPAARRPTCWP